MVIVMTTMVYLQGWLCMHIRPIVHLRPPHYQLLEIIIHQKHHQVYHTSSSSLAIRFIIIKSKWSWCTQVFDIWELWMSDFEFFFRLLCFTMPCQLKKKNNKLFDFWRSVAPINCADYTPAHATFIWYSPATRLKTRLSFYLFIALNSTDHPTISLGLTKTKLKCDSQRKVFKI